MRPLILSNVISTREHFITFIIFKGLIFGVEGSVVTLEIFVTTETTITEFINEGSGLVPLG